MKTSIFCAMIALSVLAAREAHTAGIEDVKCNYYDSGGQRTTPGILHEISSDSTIKQLRLKCQVFQKCTDSSQEPACVPEVIHKSAQSKNSKKY